MTHARLEKLGALSDPVDPNPVIWDGYFVLGHYVVPPTIGQRFMIERYQRNDIAIDGIMTTSAVTHVGDEVHGSIEFETLNSRYQLKTLPPL